MNRYQTSNIIRDTNGNRVQATTLLAAPDLSERDIYIKTTSVERLDLLANQFYDDVTLWWVIAAANNLGKGTLYVPTNTQLRIPDKAKITDFIANLNSTR